MGRSRILIIEHQASQVDELSGLLAGADHHVFVATDSVRGISMARRERPDLVLCALAQPSRGLEVLVTLRAERAFDAMPIVAVTFFSSPEDQRHLRANGFDGVIPKPVSRESFVAQVERFLPAGSFP
jgi:CheY-like chemotaxis protein